MNALTSHEIISDPMCLTAPELDVRAALFRKKLLRAALDYAAKGYPVVPATTINEQKRRLSGGARARMATRT